MDNDFFYNGLSERAATRMDRAVLVAAFAARFLSLEEISTREIGRHFQKAHLAIPNQTELARALKRDSRVSCRDGKIRPLKGAKAFLSHKFPEYDEILDAATQASVPKTFDFSLPFLEADYQSRLEAVVTLYRTVHAIENSMRGLIRKVLEDKYGVTWWDKSANLTMKRKHADRLEKERSRKWLPARTDLGPLYSLDWSDLMTLMRNNEAEFLPYIGEVNFLHRFADMGLVRHVIAHNGFLEDEDEATRALLALRDWKKQVAGV